jgi:predicted RNase H-like HicB family nuclease
MSCTFTAIVYWEEDVYVAECPQVGTASQGDTIEEAIANLKEATELYLEEFPLPKTSPRLLTTFEIQIQKQPTDIALKIPTIANYPSRREFMQLPLEERRNILAKQAEVMWQYYQEDKEWQELESRDLIDY